jgi:hypothetical protein
MQRWTERMPRRRTLSQTRGLSRSASMRRLLARALSLTVAYMGTTVFAVGAGLVTFVVTTLIKAHREGWASVKASWIGDAGWAVSVALLIWFGLFLFCLGRSTSEFKEGGSEQNPIGLKERARLFAAELSQFARQRLATHPMTLLNKDALPAPMDIGQLNHDSILHSHETDAMYFQRFASRISALREEFVNVGIDDPELDRLYLKPSLNGDIGTIGECIVAMTERLPPTPPDIRQQNAEIKRLSAELAETRERSDRSEQYINDLEERFAVARTMLAEMQSDAQPRRLTADEKERIAAVTRERLAEFDRQDREAYGKDADLERFQIAVIAIGSETETLDYRNDFVEAFIRGGFDVSFAEWKAGAPEYQIFRGAITVLNEQANNRVRPLLVDALSAAGIASKSADLPVVEDHSPYRKRNTVTLLGGVIRTSQFGRFGATLVVGQRV